MSARTTSVVTGLQCNFVQFLYVFAVIPRTTAATFQYVWHCLYCRLKHCSASVRISTPISCWDHSVSSANDFVTLCRTPNSGALGFVGDGVQNIRQFQVSLCKSFERPVWWNLHQDTDHISFFKLRGSVPPLFFSFSSRFLSPPRFCLSRLRNYSEKSGNFFFYVNPRCTQNKVTTWQPSICVAGLVAWNSLPLEIRSAPTLTTFKNMLKTHKAFLMFLLYWPTVSQSMSSKHRMAPL